ncbi:hypothetical protein KKD19_03655 [Patescibacteria group bacterium]|nr:hypothetical protein [Patescibacteria group bacterium]MBU4512308.1 hypothetical protein [Patescibacteria group bacterium]MCG2692759.1 hypothetical protein [Candidatus Parcubacteria bacterium]
MFTKANLYKSIFFVVAISTIFYVGFYAWQTVQEVKTLTDAQTNLLLDIHNQ